MFLGIAYVVVALYIALCAAASHTLPPSNPSKNQDSTQVVPATPAASQPFTEKSS